MGYLDKAGLSRAFTKLKTLIDQKADVGHTHLYAGSSSVGGSANSAVKLDSSAGGTTQPVYFSGGKPVAIPYTIGKSVPSNAVFTDTTYGTGSSTTAGLTKLYTGTGSATDGTMTQSAITSALSSKANNHSHPYLPTAGGTMSGNITFADVGDVGTAKGLFWYGSTDGASIYYETRAADEGHLVLNMFDDASVTVDIAAGGNMKSYFDYGGTFHGNVAGKATSADRAIEVADYNNTGQGIKIGFAGDGFTSADFTYALGMSSERKIKDVSKDEYRKWLGLGSAAYTSSGAYAASSHSHNYAGSSSAGGNANWANGSTYANYSYNDKPITTAGTGAAYTASVSGLTLVAGASFVMVPHTASTTTTPTLNVNSLGAKNIRMRLSSSTSSTISLISAGFLAANKPVRVVYDGTYWVLDDFAQPDASCLYGTLISRGTSAPSNGTGGFIYIQTT